VDGAGREALVGQRSADWDGPQWTTRMELRIRKLGVRVPPGVLLSARLALVSALVEACDRLTPESHPEVILR
jgi:hypothetical protein